MKFIPVTERLPQQGDLYHVNIRMIDGDGTIFPAAINFYGKEWEMSGDGYEVVEWLDKSTAPTPIREQDKEVKDVERTVGYEANLNEYLEDGINYFANTIRNANTEDLKQLASDSFHAGAKFMARHFAIISTPPLSVGELNKMAKLVIWTDGAYKLVSDGVTYEFENDATWLTTISIKDLK